MKIIYINQYFKPPSEAGSTRSYWVAQEMLKRGYEVTMICHSNTLKYGVRQEKLVKQLDVDGIKVISIRNSYSNNMGPAERIFSFLKFMIVSTWIVLRENDVNLVFASSTPLTVAVPALMRKWFRRTPFFFEVRDLWPEAPIQLGFIKNPLLIKILRSFEKMTYLQSIHINTLSPGMKEGVLQYTPENKVSMIPNMAKIDQFWPREKITSVDQMFDLSRDKFKLVYFGTLGIANGIDQILKVIKKLDKQGCSKYEFVFMGEGRMKPEIIKLSKLLDNVKVTIIDQQPMDNVSKIVNNCDVSLCTFSNIPILKTNSPNKLFDTLSAGKPSIVNSDGWTKKIVEEYKCGFYVDPKSVEDFIAKINELYSSPQLRKIMGQNARKLAKDKFDKEILCNELVDYIDDFVKNEKSLSSLSEYKKTKIKNV